MNKYLEQLIELSKIDKEIDAFGPKVEEIESTLRAAAAKEEEISNSIATLEEEVKECRVKKSKNSKRARVCTLFTRGGASNSTI